MSLKPQFSLSRGLFFCSNGPRLPVKPVSKPHKSIQNRWGLVANMRPRRTPNSDRGTSAPRGDDGHGHDGGRDRGRDHSHEHDVRGRYHAHDRDDRVPRQTQLSGTTRQQLSRKPEQTCEASGPPFCQPAHLSQTNVSSIN